MTNEIFSDRLTRIVSQIDLGMDCAVLAEYDDEGRYYLQIECWRKDVVTGKDGFGYGGRAYPDPDSTDSQLVQIIFGLYRAYWEHEARETFQWRGRRIFGPHISSEALWDAAPRVDVRSARHVEDRRGR